MHLPDLAEKLVLEVGASNGPQPMKLLAPSNGAEERELGKEKDLIVL
jgi:hypothetical protein